MVDFYNRFEDPKHIAWARAVKERDKFTCQICFATDCYLHSHHQNSWDFFETERFDIDNGITLCEKHHNDFHNMYGHGHNTKYQFEEFQQFYELIKELAFANCKREILDENGREQGDPENNDA